jgi:putative ABC transport system ATP-binding protein
MRGREGEEEKGRLRDYKKNIFSKKCVIDFGMVEINNVSKTYKRGSEKFRALDNVTLKLEKGDYVSVTGPSGSGKSTLLNITGGLIKPDSGEVLFNRKNIYRQASRLTDEYRKKHVGFMFQQFHLMPYLTVFENIKLACYTRQHLESIHEYMVKCSLDELKTKYPSELSVGEKQRVAFIRAIVSNPDILLADEPTGNLDPGNTNILMSLIESYHNNGGTVVIVSHNPSINNYSTRQLFLEKGQAKIQ